MGNGGCLRAIRVADQVTDAIVDGDDQSPSPEGVALDLMAVDPKSVSKVPFKNQLIDARVCKVYDGDTITVIFELAGQPMKVSVRVVGVDCPELKPTKPKDGCEDYDQLMELYELEAAAGKVCRDHVAELILEKIIKVKFLKNDKYGGRYLGEVFLPSSNNEPPQSLTTILCSEGYAKPYEGDKKEPWTKEQLIKGPFQHGHHNQQSRADGSAEDPQDPADKGKQEVNN